MNSAQILTLLSRRALLISALLVLIATLRIAATYPVFSHTSDEPAHIACGMEWLSKGTYRYEAQHPPLTRVMAALGPFFDGARTTGHEDFMAEGLILLRGQSLETYERRLTLSRMGILPLFWIACLAVFLLGKKALGDAGAVLAVLVFTMLPVILAHAGLATTDMGATAFFALSLYCLFALIEEPVIQRGLLYGAALAGMVLSKFSTLAFFIVTMLFCVIHYCRMSKPSSASLMEHARRLTIPMLGSLLVTFLLIWAAYRFSFGPAPYAPFSVPFPELFAGLKQVVEHNEKGHLSYFLGQTSMSGSWLFFPVVLLVKTPLAVLALAAVSLFMARPKAAGAPAGFVWTVIAAVLAVAMTANINIGLRHILPLMPFLAVAAASGLVVLLEKAGRSRLPQDAALASIVLLAGSSIMAHPDYLPYFNLLAGGHPEKIVVDSDLDWGQDIKRLGARLRELRAQQVVFTPLIISDLNLMGFPPRQAIDPMQPLPGYNAVSLTQLKLDRLYLPAEQRNLKPWPENLAPAEVVGKTILLYRFRPARAPQE